MKKTDTIIRKVAGRVFSVEVPATHSAKHGLLVSNDDLARAELAIAAALATDGPPSAEGLRFMRGALGLAAKDLATLLDVTAVQVSRWENGASPVPTHAWVVLGTIVLERAGRPTVTEERMTRIASGFKPPKERRVEL